MSRGRKNPPAPGAFSSAAQTTRLCPCRDPAVWLMFFVGKETGKKENRNACGAHVNRLLNVLTPRAEYSREMFRVIP
ncbi:hypothetical protein ACFWY6_31755 [Streptomyces sp. NPDC059037]|uniref:hypothetical protein n=1 Tax=Streptomyces sp. NPDC059037 TaxID=3346710 RepID=UPI003697DE79